MSRVIICGGGLAGGITAIALAKRRPDVELLLVEKDMAVGGNHIWSFFDSDVPEDERWLVDEVARRRWPDHEVKFPRRSRRIALGYNSIHSSDLDSAVRACLRPEQLILGADVADIGPGFVTVGGKQIDADCVIDARGAGPMGSLELGWQKFLGRVYRFAEPHRVTRPTIMDATVPQVDGFRFVYLLPLSETELLIEDTYYSATPLLAFHDLAERLASYARALDRGDAEPIHEESGVLPVVISGSLEDLWPSSDPLPRLGLRGGFFHPTTGYSFPDAVANAVFLGKQRSWDSGSIGGLLRARAERLWRARRFFQILNRMLFRAADPGERYRVLEHFYRLPLGTVSRFYAARLTSFDKLRILSGRSPVPIRRAIAVLGGKAA